MIALVLLLAATPAQDAFYAATDLVRAGDFAKAAQAYEEVARKWPDDDIADDAVAEAAQLREERLGDPEGALRLWEQLVKQWPESRLARRAQSRIDFLRGALTAGAEPLRIYQDVLAQYAQRPHAESIARMEEVVRRFPNFPLLPQAWFWLAEAYQQEKRWDDALRAFNTVRERFPDGEWAARAEKGIGDVWLERGETMKALRAYDRLKARGGPWSEAADYGRHMAHKAQLERALLWTSAAVLVLFTFGYATRARGGRLVFPTELKYYLPVAVAFTVAAYTEHKAIFRATAILAAYGAVAAFLVPQRPIERRGWHTTAIVLAAAAAFMVAIQTQHLTDVLLETLRQGAER